MSEGGKYAWRRQEIDEHRGPAVTYKHLRRPLSNPPKDMHWVYDKNTREWRLEQNPESELVVDAQLVEVIDPDSPEILTKHEIQYTDTFDEICLRYKVTPTELRRANFWFTGTDLHLAPNPLSIPKTTENFVEAQIISDTGEETPKQKINRLRRLCLRLSKSEAKCYLELNDWDLNEAHNNAREDGF